MTLHELRTNHRQGILELAAQYGAHNVRVFGSTLHDGTGADSDVDLLVELEAGRSLFDLGGLQVDLEDLLGCRVDLLTEPGLHWTLRDRILQEAVAL